MYAVVAVAAVLYIAFIYAYPKIFPHIQKADPQNYRETIDTALGQGNTAAALNAARFAASWFRLDPDAQTTYGELLIDSGDANEARKQFEKAVALTTTPAPESRSTRLPYFHPRARLALGQLALKQGDVGSAMAQFELARPLAQLNNTEYQRFHEAAAEAYAHAGIWSRVLEFQQPTPDTLADLDRENLVTLIIAAEAAQTWNVLAHAGRALLAKDTGDPSGHYAVGRAMVAESKYADAVEPLQNATENGHHDAPYYLGVARQTLGEGPGAVAAFRNTPHESLYRIFALDKALQLLNASGDGDERELVRAEFLGAIEASCPIALNPTPPMLGVLHATPTAIQFAAPRVSAAIMPVLVRWHRNTATSPAVSPAVDPAQPGSLTLNHDDDIFQLQWAKNHLPLGNFESSEIGSRDPAGWIDPAAAWAKTRELAIGVIEASPVEAGNILSITTESPEQRGLLYSIPLVLRPGAVYALAGRMHAPGAKAVFGYEFLGEREQVVAAGNVVNQRIVPEWTWQASVTQAQYPWNLARVVLGLYQAAGTAAFDDVALLELAVPTP